MAGMKTVPFRYVLTTHGMPVVNSHLLLTRTHSIARKEPRIKRPRTLPTPPVGFVVSGV